MKSEKKEARRSLLKSGLSFFLCVALLISFTFAWFTTVVRNEGNTIKSGNIEFRVWGYDAEKVADAYPLKDDGGAGTGETPRNLANKPLITQTDFYPDDYNVKYVQIENLSNIDAKFKFALSFSGLSASAANLGEVIKVNIGTVTKPDALAGVKRPDDSVLSGWKTLSNYTQYDGNILAGKDEWFKVEYYFCKGAGNTYQNMTDFSFDLIVGGIQVNADAKDLVFVSTPEELLDALTSRPGSTIVFLNDIEIDDELDSLLDGGKIVIDTPHNFDLNGHWLKIPGKTLLFDFGDGFGCAMDIANGYIVADGLEFDCGDTVVNLGNKNDTLPLHLYLNSAYVAKDTVVHEGNLDPTAPDPTIVLIHREGDPALKPYVSADNVSGNYIVIDGWAVYSDGSEGKYYKKISVSVGTTVLDVSDGKFTINLVWSGSNVYLMSWLSPLTP